MFKSNTIFALITAVLVVAGASFFASSSPDGLEFVASKLGFERLFIERYHLMKDYTVPFLGKGPLSTMFAGIAGIFICIAFTWAFYWLCKISIKGKGHSRSAHEQFFDFKSAGRLTTKTGHF